MSSVVTSAAFAFVSAREARREYGAEHSLSRLEELTRYDELCDAEESARDRLVAVVSQAKRERGRQQELGL